MMVNKMLYLSPHKRLIDLLLSDAIDAATCIHEESPSQYDKVLMSRLKVLQKTLNTIANEEIKSL